MAWVQMSFVSALIWVSSLAFGFEMRPVGARLIFIPEGFDDNDVSEVVLDGYLPNGCYRLADPKVEFSRGKREIVITPMARYFAVPCIEALIPFTQPVYLGILPVGDYTIRVSEGEQGPPPRGHLHVSEAQSAGPDDFLYAPVDQVVVRSENGEFIAEVSGRFTLSCLRFAKPEFRGTSRAIALLPVTEKEGACEVGDFPFHEEFVIPGIHEAGRYLLHVRSLSGKALNAVFYKVDRS